MIRVFPRKTSATPDDSLAFVGGPPEKFYNTAQQVIHISCTFTYDKSECERLAELWGKYGVVNIGGPAYGDRGDNFTPGQYLKKGYVITSRGCPSSGIL